MNLRSVVIVGMLLSPALGSAQPPAKPRLDGHGFPLPDGAIARLGDLHFAQRGWINGIAVAADGKTVATAGAPHRRQLRGYGDFEHSHVYLWNAETGRITHDIPVGIDAWPRGFSKDGKILAVTWAPGFQFVDVAKGTLFWPNDRKERPTFVKPHFLDGDRLMVGQNFQDVEVWDVAKGTLVRSWKVTKKGGQRVENLKLEGREIRVSLSPSGATMAWFVRTPVGQRDWPARAEVHVFDTLTGARKGTIEGLIGYYHDAALLDEGETVLVETTFLGADPRGSRDSGGNVALDVKTGKERFRIHHIIGRDDGQLVPTRNPIEGFRLAAVAPDGKSFYTFGTRSLRERRDMATGKLIAKLDSYARGEESIFGFAGDGKRTVVGDNCRWYWGDLDLKPLTPRTEWPHEFALARYLSADRIRIPGGDNTFRVWDLRAKKFVESGSLPPVPNLHPEPASLDWRHPKGRDAEHRLLVANHRGQLVVLDRAEGNIRCRLEGVVANGRDGVNWPVVSADGAITIVPQLDGKDMVVTSFDNRTGRRLASHRVPTADVFPGYFPLFPYGEHARPAVRWYSDDASVFGYTTRDSRLTLVETRTGKAIRTLGFAGPRIKDPVVKRPAPMGDPTKAPVLIEPDPAPPLPAWFHFTVPHRSFIVASTNQFVKGAGHEYALFDRATGAVLRHRMLPAGGAFSHDGRFVFCHRNIDDVFIYETSTGTLRGSIATKAGAGLSLVIGSDDRTMATGCADTSILVWDLDRPIGGEPDLPPADAPGAKVADYWQALGEVERNARPLEGQTAARE
jgi:WD40 repeat protein